MRLEQNFENKNMPPELNTVLSKEMCCKAQYHSVKVQQAHKLPFEVNPAFYQEHDGIGFSRPQASLWN